MVTIVRKTFVSSTIVVAVLIFMITSPASAQEKAGEVLKQLEKKEIVPRTPATPIIEKKEEKPQPIPAGQKILIKQIIVTVRNKSRDGEKPLLAPEAIRAITSKYENRELTLPEINRIAEDITANYRAHGHILAYAYIAQQEIKDGILEIGIIEGKTGEITVTGNKSYSSKFIRKHLEKIKKDPSLKENTLERALLILNEYPSLDVKALLKAGKAFGTTDITAQTKDSLPISGSLSYDNFGTDTTSKHRLSAEFNIGNLLASGDLLMFRGLTGLDRIDLKNLSYGRAEYLIPVCYNGTKAGIYYTNSVYEAGEQFTVLDINGKARVAGVYVAHPIIKTRDQALDVRFGFDHKDVYEYLLGDSRSQDNIRVFNLGMTYNVIDRLYGRNVINLTYHQGVRDILGGNGRNDAGTSRLNADGGFSKGTVDAVRFQKLPGYNHLMFKAGGQYSKDALFVAEQFYLGGVSSIRGFASSSKSGDSGYSLSAELYLAPPYPETKIFHQDLGNTIKFVLFADHGGVFRNDVHPGEDKNAYLTGIGAGIRIYAGKYFSARLDYAVPSVDGKYKTGNSEIYVQTVFSF
ncbi:MAG: ShlB/FhaC/HecB family hemolysin secretion/activation protein [Deltaproteobacteria bacterium]|nr:ShlB/FhaC/HecB family hemolysin secretion/activation protein [Deltaproteobacteria bacterium]